MVCMWLWKNSCKKMLLMRWSLTRILKPVAKGDKVGQAIFYSNGEEIGRMDLVSSEDVPKGNIFRVISDSIIRFFRGLIRRV